MLQQWSQSGFHFQHLSALFTLAVGDLYEGKYQSAHQRIERRWREIEGSFLLRSDFVRKDSWYLRGRTALGAGFAGVASLAEVERTVRRGIREIEQDDMPWSRGMAFVLRAGLAQLGGAGDRAARALEQAALAFGAQDMRVHHAVCQLQLAWLRRTTNEDAETTLRQEGVKEAPRFANALAPVRALGPL